RALEQPDRRPFAPRWPDRALGPLPDREQNRGHRPARVPGEALVALVGPQPAPRPVGALEGHAGVAPGPEGEPDRGPGSAQRPDRAADALHRAEPDPRPRTAGGDGQDRFRRPEADGAVPPALPGW